jgi:trimethylamine--corrinoid protein Co-methyltransferase
MTSSETPPLQPIRPAYHLQILSVQQLNQLKSATLEILKETGIHCPSTKSLRIFFEHGAQVDFSSQVVKFPPDVVLKAMSAAPRFYCMGARSRAYDINLDGKSTYMATDGCGVEVIDFISRKRRNSCKQDVADMARVSDFLSSIGFYWPIVSAQDHPRTAPLHELHASFNNTVKHIQSETLMGEKLARYAVAMALVIAGDKVAMRNSPPLSLLVCCISPLGLDRDGMESALVLAEAGLPVGFMSMATVGSTAPATLAGTLVAADAEIVAAMTLIQMAFPGAPIFHSMMPGFMQPHTGAYLATAREGTLLYPIGVELAHNWGVPSLAGVFATDGQTPGWQSAGDGASSLMLCALTGADTASGMGLLESCTLLYPEEIILDDDLYHRIRLEAAGLDIRPETLALDIINKVGPRGQYLHQRHTRDHLRRRSFSDLTSQTTPAGVLREPVAVARDKVEWILAHHHPEPLSVGQQKELTLILDSADQELS